jgi:hypothetical protein
MPCIQNLPIEFWELCTHVCYISQKQWNGFLGRMSADRSAMKESILSGLNDQIFGWFWKNELGCSLEAVSRLGRNGNGGYWKGGHGK